MTLKLSTPHFISKVSALFQLDRRDYVWLGVLIALAIIVQGGMLRLQFSTPDGDFVGHVRIARRIVEEGVLEGPHIVYHVIVNTLTLVIGDRTTAGLLVVLAAQVVLLPIIYGLLRPVMANTKLIVSAVIAPTVLLLIAQYALGFSDAEAGIAVAPFSVVGHLTGYGVPQLILLFFLSILFPLLVVLYRWHTARRDVGLVVSWLAFLAGAVQMYFLSETGVRQ